MGRVKLQIRRLESTSNRQITYSKRKSGILKKAKELSVLCDIDIAMLMFSPNGKPTIFHGARSNLDEITAKYAQLPPQERAKRKLESLEVLKKTFKKLDHDINVDDFLDTSAPSHEELYNQLRLLRGQLTDAQKRLSWWSNLEKNEDVEHLTQMEDSLKESLNKLRVHKENFAKDQVMPLANAEQPHNTIHFPTLMVDEQEAQTLSWLQNNENNHMLTTESPNFFCQRDLEYTGSTSIPCSLDLFDTGKGSGLSDPGQFCDIEHPLHMQIPMTSTGVGDASSTRNMVNRECSVDALLPSCSSFFDYSKYPDIENTREIDSITHEVSGMDDYSAIACLRLQLCGQTAYYPESSLTMQQVKKPDVAKDMDFQHNTTNYQTPDNFQLTSSLYNNSHNVWNPSISSACENNIIDGTLYNQPSRHPYEKLP